MLLRVKLKYGVVKGGQSDTELPHYGFNVTWVCLVAELETASRNKL